MALKGLDIYKKLPKTNCKECGVPTCLAFAMKVAAGQAELTECTQLSEDAEKDLAAAAAPPQRLVTIGPDDKAIELGQETVLFRHDEKFHHPTAIALAISDTCEDLPGAVANFKALTFTRVGEQIAPDMLAVLNESGSPDTFSKPVAPRTSPMFLLTLISSRGSTSRVTSRRVG